MTIVIHAEHRGLLNAGQSKKQPFHFLRSDLLSTDLDLSVSSSKANQIPVFRPDSHITGAEGGFFLMPEKDVCFGYAAVFLKIALTNHSAAYADFPAHAGRKHGSGLVHKKNAASGDGFSGRDS